MIGVFRITLDMYLSYCGETLDQFRHQISHGDVPRAGVRSPFIKQVALKCAQFAESGKSLFYESLRI